MIRNLLMNHLKEDNEISLVNKQVEKIKSKTSKLIKEDHEISANHPCKGISQIFVLNYK